MWRTKKELHPNLFLYKNCNSEVKSSWCQFDEWATMSMMMMLISKNNKIEKELKDLIISGNLNSTSKPKLNQIMLFGRFWSSEKSQNLRGKNLRGIILFYWKDESHSRLKFDRGKGIFFAQGNTFLSLSFHSFHPHVLLIMWLRAKNKVLFPINFKFHISHL